MSDQSDNLIPYPTGFLRIIFRLPMQLHRYGLGWMLDYVPLLILTTKGRKSGLPRHAVLEYRRHGSKVYLVSGWGDRPHWYKNLVAYPCVTVQRGSHTQQARASVVTSPAEAFRALHMFRRNRPLYDRLFAQMSSAETIDTRTLTEVAQEFTVVRLDLEDTPPQLPGVPTISRWLGPVVVLGSIALLLWGLVALLASLSSSDKS